MNSGIYFLGDDGVYDWAACLLRSLRIAAPEVKLFCIPFSDRLSKLRELKDILPFDIVEHESLPELDAIGRDLITRDPVPRRVELAGMYRKLVVFWGPLDHFLYLDADIVVLNGFQEFFSESLRAPFDVQYAHSSLAEAYGPGSFREEMVRDYKTHAINAGLWMARRGAVTLAQVREAAVAARPHAGDLCCFDQSFINFCLDINRVPMSTFTAKNFECAWAGDSRKMSWQRDNLGGTRATWPDGTQVPIIHWAGYRLTPQMPYYDLHRGIRTTGMSTNDCIKLKWKESVDALKNSRSVQRVKAFLNKKS